MNTLPAFTDTEREQAKLLLAAQVASMMGRKLEEDDWSSVYCKAKNITPREWSNVNIDVNEGGLGVEFKMLRVKRLKRNSIKDVCGTTRMHPSATRSIRIEDVNLPAHEVMVDVLNQYSDFIEARTKDVRDNNPDGTADMRTGWLLWESGLREFLYFEESMTKPDPANYCAIWNETPPRGARKGSKSLWIFDRVTRKKLYSVTTSSGIKIQPYFDVPSPLDPNLIHFEVQSEVMNDGTVILWISAKTADRLRELLGSTDEKVVNEAVFKASKMVVRNTGAETVDSDVAVPIRVSQESFDLLDKHWEAVSDEHRIQQLIDVLTNY